MWARLDGVALALAFAIGLAKRMKKAKWLWYGVVAAVSYQKDNSADSYGALVVGDCLKDKSA